MHISTASNLRNAFGGESMARLRYEIWGHKAKQEGLPNVARLFAAISRAEAIHAGNHFRALGKETGDALCASMAVFGLTGTSDNLQGGINGETFEITEMYPTYLETARFQTEKAAQTSFNWALEAEKTHAALFQKAKQAVDATRADPPLGPVHVCSVCGWTHEGDAPDTCPVCNATRDRFETFA